MTPTPSGCNRRDGVSEFGVSDSPCNTSTMSEWGVNFITSRWDYVGE